MPLVPSLDPAKLVARRESNPRAIIRRHLANILNYLNHRITDAVTEGLNAKSQWIKYSSRGFRDRERFQAAIYCHCGGLDLDPR